MAEITDTGLVVDTMSEILEDLTARTRAALGAKIDLSEREVLGNYNPIIAEKLEQIYELLSAAYNAYDRDNAEPDSVRSLAVLLGVPQRGATKGLVAVTLTFSGAQSYSAGAITMQVVDEPENLWVNRDGVEATGAGGVQAIFESVAAGSAAIANSSTLTVFPSGLPTGITAGTNPKDSQNGLDIESIEALKIRMAQSVARGGSRTTQAIRSALVQLAGILSADVYENTDSTPDANGLPGHSLRAVVWDGSPGAADDDEIAQVIWDRSATYAHGSQSGIARDAKLGDVQVRFDRATEVPITVAINVVASKTVAIADVKAALIADMPGGAQGRVGAAVVYNQLSCAAFDVDGVENWTTFTIDGSTSDKPALQTTIYTLDSSDITVTGDVA